MANATKTKFGDPASRIAQTARWSVLLRPRQPTLGSLVLVCREPALAFADLSPEAFGELRGVVRAVEHTLRGFTTYERINYLMLMMVDPDVHFHVIPRYSGSRTFMGVDYRDAGWPGPPVLEPAVALDDAARGALVDALRQAWPQAGG
jgi:diadenosine tetraphosphate (Ap4A) HIT family hydrolase